MLQGREGATIEPATLANAERHRGMLYAFIICDTKEKGAGTIAGSLCVRATALARQRLQNS
jgi:hypothetical protein